MRSLWFSTAFLTTEYSELVPAKPYTGLVPSFYLNHFLNQSPTSIAILLLSLVLASLLKLFLNYRLTLPAVKDQEMALPMGAPCPTGTFLMTPTVVYLRLDRFSSCCSTSSVWPDFDRFLFAGQWKPRILSPILCWLVAPQGLLLALCFIVGWGRIRLDCLWAGKPTIEGGHRSEEERLYRGAGLRVDTYIRSYKGASVVSPVLPGSLLLFREMEDRESKVSLQWVRCDLVKFKESSSSGYRLALKWKSRFRLASSQS